MKKKQRETKLERHARSIVLGAREKRALREQIVSYMEYHPMQRFDSVADLGMILPRESFTYVRLRGWYMRPILGALALVLVVGLPMAAEKTAPGDVLYPLKVRINEEIKDTLTFSPYERVAWNVARVERRIAEARLLAEKGELTTEAEAALAANLKEHTDNANESLATLRSTDKNQAVVAQVAFESALDVQSALLFEELSINSGTSTAIADIARAVQTARADVEKMDDTTLLPFEHLSASVESETTRARELLSSLTDSISPEEHVDVERRFADVDRAILAAMTLKEAGQESEAKVMLRKVLGDIQKLITFMTNIDVRANVTLEALVPKKLTSDERVQGINQSLENLRGKLRAVEARGEGPDEAVEKKRDAGMEEVVALVSTIEREREQNNFDGADLSLRNAHALIDDITNLYQGTPDAPSTSSPEVSSTTASSTPVETTMIGTSTATVTPASL